MKSSSNIIWTFFLTLNAFIVLATYRRLRASQIPITYSFMDGDRPVDLLVGPDRELKTVEMTFSESARFGLSSDESKANWNTLWTNQVGIGYQHPGPFQFRAITGMYHTMHCVNQMQIWFDIPKHDQEPSEHFIHCIHLLKEIFLCNADMTLEKGDFMKRNHTTDRVGETRQCRDWSQVNTLLATEFDEWLARNGAQRSDLGALPTKPIT